MSVQVRRDLEFRKAFQPPPGLVCPKLQPKLTNILEEHLVWDEQELANFSKGIECEGSKVFRRRGSDEEVVASAKFPLQVGLPFKMDPGLLQVVCFAKDSQREVVYSNVHFLPKLPPTNPKPPPRSPITTLTHVCVRKKKHKYKPLNNKPFSISSKMKSFSLKNKKVLFLK